MPRHAKNREKEIMQEARDNQRRGVKQIMIYWNTPGSISSIHDVQLDKGTMHNKLHAEGVEAMSIYIFTWRV